MKNPAVPDPISHYTSFPLLNEILLKEGLEQVGICWYLFRTYIRDYRTSGFVVLSDLAIFLSKQLQIKKSRVYDLLSEGDNVFWTKSHSKAKKKTFIGVRSLPKVLAHFNILPPPEKISSLKIKEYHTKYLTGTIQEQRAHLLKTTIVSNDPLPEYTGRVMDYSKLRESARKSSQRSQDASDKEVKGKTTPPRKAVSYKEAFEKLESEEKSEVIQDRIQHTRKVTRTKSSAKPISRETIQDRTGVTPETQRQYAKICNKRGDRIWTQENLVILLPFTDAEYSFLLGDTEAIPNQNKEALWHDIMEITNNEGLGGKYRLRTVDGLKGLFQQIPNSYSDEARYVKNPLLVKYQGHSSQTRKKTLGKELAEVLKDPESQSEKSKFQASQIYEYQEAKHNYLHKLQEPGDGKEIKAWMEKKEVTYFENFQPLKSRKRFHRECLWTASNASYSVTTLALKYSYRRKSTEKIKS